MPPFIARPMPNSLPTDRAGAGADVAFGRRIARRRLAGGVAGGGVGADARVADPEVEQDRRRHDRHDERLRAPSAGAPIGDADAALVEPAHHAAGGVEAEGAAAGEHDRVHLVDRVDRMRAARSRACPGAAPRTSTPATAPSRGDHDRAAGRPARVGEVADLEAGDGGQATRHRRRMPATVQAKTPAVSCIRARHLAELEQRVAEGHLDHRQPLEVVAGGVLVGDADAAVQLDALLADEAHRRGRAAPWPAPARAAARPPARRASSVA